MIRITKTQKEDLEKAGLLRYRQTRRGIEVDGGNIIVSNSEHTSRDKTYYVEEDYKIMSFLGLVGKKPRRQQNHNKSAWDKSTRKKG